MYVTSGGGRGGVTSQRGVVDVCMLLAEGGGGGVTSQGVKGNISRTGMSVLCMF